MKIEKVKELFENKETVFYVGQGVPDNGKYSVVHTFEVKRLDKNHIYIALCFSKTSLVYVEIYKTKFKNIIFKTKVLFRGKCKTYKSLKTIIKFTINE